jgi:nickel-dependent lactate racemase
LEAKAYGATFSVSASAIRRGYELEEKALEKWGKDKDQDMNELVARKKWRVVIDKSPEDVGAWTKGQEYVRKVGSGERPTYKIGKVDSWTSILPGGEPSSNVERKSSLDEHEELGL